MMAVCWDISAITHQGRGLLPLLRAKSVSVDRELNYPLKTAINYPHTEGYIPSLWWLEDCKVVFINRWIFLRG